MTTNGLTQPHLNGINDELVFNNDDSIANNNTNSNTNAKQLLASVLMNAVASTTITTNHTSSINETNKDLNNNNLINENQMINDPAAPTLNSTQSQSQTQFNSFSSEINAVSSNSNNTNLILQLKQDDVRKHFFSSFYLTQSIWPSSSASSFYFSSSFC